MARKAGETWPGAAKAIGLRALSSGKFWQFCFLCVLIAFAFNIKSPDWVKIAELFLLSYLYSGLAWILWVATIVIAVVLHKAQRRRYLGEIERLARDRDKLQDQLTGTTLQHSKYKPQ